MTTEPVTPDTATPSAGDRARVAANSISALVLYAVSIATAFLISPIMVRELGNRNYGVWDLLLSLTGYLNILEIGLGPAVMRYTALASRNDDSESLRRVFSSALAVFTAVGFLALLIMLGLSRASDSILNLAPGEVAHTSSLFLLAGLNIGIQFPGTVLASYMLGLQKHSAINSCRALITIASALANYYVLTSWPGPKLLAVASIALGSNVLYYTWTASWMLRHEHRLSVARRYVSFATMRELYSFGFKSMLLLTSDRIRRASMPLVIAHTIGVDAVVFYTIPNRLVEYMSQFGLAVGYPLTPYFSALSGERDASRVRQEWFFLSRALQFICAGSAVGTLVLGPSLISIWMGPSYSDRGRWVIYWLAGGLLVSSLAANALRVLVSKARHDRAARLLLPASVLTLGLAIPLSSAWGVSGAAFASFIAWDFTTLLVLREACSALEISVREHFRRTVAPLLMPVLVLAAVLLVAQELAPAHSYGQLLLYTGLGGSAYLTAGLLMALTPAERASLRIRLLSGSADPPAPRDGSQDGSSPLIARNGPAATDPSGTESRTGKLP